MSENPLLLSPSDAENDSNIRKVWHNGEWYFSVVDMIANLLDKNRKDGSTYWRKLKSRLLAEGNESVTKCHRLKLMADDGKKYLTDVITSEQALRLIQSIPSPKVEWMKQWLATVGAERLDETRDPEAVEERIIIENRPDTDEARRRRKERRVEKFRQMGRDDGWIATREFGIITRLEFTARIKELLDNRANYAQLTDDVYKGVHHRNTRQLRTDLGIQPDENPRDYMHRIGLHYIGIAEEACQIKLAHLRDEDAVPANLVRDIIVLVSKQVGMQADELALALGIDIVTGRPLLSSKTL
jgi:hypothetical protein